MSMARLLHLPWSPILATAVVLWVVGEPMLTRKSSIFPPQPKAAKPAGNEAELEINRILIGKASRLTNYSIGEPVAL